MEQRVVSSAAVDLIVTIIIAGLAFREVVSDPNSNAVVAAIAQDAIIAFLSKHASFSVFESERVVI